MMTDTQAVCVFVLSISAVGCVIWTIVHFIVNTSEILLNKKTNFNRIKFGIFKEYVEGRLIYRIKFKYSIFPWLKIDPDFRTLIYRVLKNDNNVNFDYNATAWESEADVKNALKCYTKGITLIKEQRLKSKQIVDVVDMSNAEDIFRINL